MQDQTGADGFLMVLVTQTYHDYPFNLYEEGKVIILGGEGTNIIRAKVFE